MAVSERPWLSQSTTSKRLKGIHPFLTPNELQCRSYLNEEDEVFEGGVEMGLLLELHDRVKVLVVDVGVHPEQTLQNGLRHRHEVTLEGDALSQQKKYREEKQGY